MKLESRAYVRGEVEIALLCAKTGKIVRRERAKNVITDAGRNFFSSLLSYLTITQAPGTDEPATSKRRYDGIRYMMVGTGTQAEVAGVTQLNNPVVYNLANHFLAQVAAPSTLPSGVSVMFEKTYAASEISTTPGQVDITEIGLFPSGIDTAPLDPLASNHAPIAYKTFSAIPKTQNYLLKVLWTIKF